MIVGPNIVRDGLILHLDAASRRSYTSGSSAWYDLSGNGNTFQGTNFNYETDISPHISLTDNGAGYMAISGSDVIGGYSNITLDMWIRLDTIQTTFALVSYEVGTTDSLLIIHNTTNQIDYLKNGSAASPVTLSDNLYDVGNWINFVAVVSSSNVDYYINGINEATSTGNGTAAYTTGGTLLFGQEQDSEGGGFNTAQDFPGDYSIIKIYNRPLSPAEIEQNYNGLNRRFKTTPEVVDSIDLTQPVLYLKPENIDPTNTVEDSYVSIWYDSSGGNRHMSQTSTDRPTLYTGTGSRQIQFDESGSVNDNMQTYGNIPTVFEPENDPFTVIARYGDVVPASGLVVAHRISTLATMNWQLGQSGDPDDIYWGMRGSNSSTFQHSTTLENALIIAVHDGTTTSIYIDGSTPFTSSVIGADRTDYTGVRYTIGAGQNYGNSLDGGNLDMVAVIPKEISTDERLAIEAEFQIN